MKRSTIIAWNNPWLMEGPFFMISDNDYYYYKERVKTNE